MLVNLLLLFCRKKMYNDSNNNIVLLEYGPSYVDKKIWFSDLWTIGSYLDDNVSYSTKNYYYFKACLL